MPHPDDRVCGSERSVLKCAQQSSIDLLDHSRYTCISVSMRHYVGFKPFHLQRSVSDSIINGRTVLSTERPF